MFSKKTKQADLNLAILKVLVFFDLFAQPLTLAEIYKYLNIKSNVLDVFSSLKNLEDRIENKNGFYYLKNRRELVAERFKKYNYFKRKMKKAVLFSKLLSFFPSVRGVAVSNIIADHNLRNESDIDLFIISSKNRIWLTRFFCTSLAKFLNLRPTKKSKKDKICLSFYISEDNLNLEKYLYSKNDYYFIYWIAGLEVIVNKNKVFEKFFLKNTWLEKYLPNIKKTKTFFRKNNKENKNKNNFLERFVKKFQLKIMPKDLKKQNSDFGGVVLKDDIIKLFLEDKRAEFISKFEESLSKYT